MDDIDRERFQALMANLERLCTLATALCSTLSRARVAVRLGGGADDQYRRARKPATKGAGRRPKTR